MRGTQDYKEAIYNLNGLEVKVAVVSGLENANTLLEKKYVPEKRTVSLLRLCVVRAAVLTAEDSRYSRQKYVMLRI